MVVKLTLNVNFSWPCFLQQQQQQKRT